MTERHQRRHWTACHGCLALPLSLRARRGTSRRNHKGLCLARGLPRLRKIERGTSTCFYNGSSASLPRLPLPPTEECLIETGTLRVRLQWAKSDSHNLPPIPLLARSNNSRHIHGGETPSPGTPFLPPTESRSAVCEFTPRPPLFRTHVWDFERCDWKNDDRTRS